MRDDDLRRIVKPDLGFALHVPEDWEEQPPHLGNSPQEVARFSFQGGGLRRTCIVFWSGTRSGLSPRHIAEGVIPTLESAGFRAFVLADVRFAQRPAARLDFERRRGDDTWTCREYVVLSREGWLCLGLGTSDAERDRELFDRMAGAFELLDAGERVAVREMALGRYGKEARSVVQLAEQSAVAAGDRELRAVHLLSGLLQQEGGAAAAVLRSLGVTHERIADQLTQPRSEGAPSEGEATVVAGGMYRLLAEAAPAHAGALNSASVDPTHLLLGLLTERGAGGRDLLEALGVHEDALLGRLAESLHERIAMQIRARAGA